jgi:hypothetical protein
LVLTLVCAWTVLGQGTPEPTDPAKAASSADKPSVKIGMTLFADYTYNSNPKTVDAAGNRVEGDSFNVGRAYLNITGNLNRRIFFRITPDITRETGAGSSLNGSYTFRLKYGYAQLNLDEWTTKGSWVRAGLHQTPYVGTIEDAYRYRFQGPVFVDREGFLSSSDAGISGHYSFPSGYGDVHAGVYNGEGYAHSEVNDQKALQARVTFRPAPGTPVAKGLSVGVFYDYDHYFHGAPRRRFVPFVLFAHERLNAGFEYLRATDRPTVAAPQIEASGFSAWASAPLAKGFEVLLRHDSLNPDRDRNGQRKTRNIAGVAYWIPNLQKVTSAVMLDTERVRYENLDRTNETRYGVHVLVSF